MKKILCTICMRSGSVGVPNKNFLKIKGRPLLWYTIDKAIKSKIFDEIVISTDSYKIASLSKKFGAKCWFIRPKKLSANKSAKLPVIKHLVLESEKYFEQKFDIICDLDATSPLRDINDIKNSYKKFIREKSNNLVSVTPANKNPYFNQIRFYKNQYDIAIKTKNKIVRRQDAPKVFDLNASIYIWKRDYLFKSNKLFSKKTSIYVMPPERSYDIDTYFDLKIVNFIIKNKKI